MDAWLLGFLGLGSASAKPVVVLSTGKSPKPAAREAAQEPPAPVAQELRRRQPQPRIAHWDKKREKCQNCSHIYLKTLSRHPGFCSVDCKSNAAYIAKVNRTIRAVKNAVDRQQQDAQSAAAESHEPVAAAAADDGDIEDSDEDAQPHTFADFGLESRAREEPNVQWAFSAVY